MRGSPLLNALLAFVVIGLFGIPVHRLTSRTTAAVPVEAAPEAATGAASTVHLEVQFTTPPATLRVRHLGKVVWQVDQPGETVESDLTLPWPAEGVELLCEAAWPEQGLPAAARFTVTTPDNEEQVRTLWGRGETSDVFTFR